jgi:hypothetical protein
VQGTAVTTSGVGVPGVQVFVPGGAPVLSDASGNFTIPNVTAPYDLVSVLTAPGSGPTVIMYQDLTRSDPRILTAGGQNAFSGDVSGSVTGGAGRPLPANHDEILSLVPETGFSGTYLIDPLTGSYSTVGSSPSWGFVSSTIIDATVVQFTEDAAGLPLVFTGAVTDSFGMNDGDVLLRDFNLSAVTTGTVSGTYTLPVGFTLGSKHAALEPTTPPFELLNLPDDAVDNGVFSFNVPAVPGRRIDVAIGANGPSGQFSNRLLRDLAPGTTGLVATVRAPPVVTSPPSGTTNVDHSTVFTFTAFTPGIHLFQTAPTTFPNTDPTYIVVTSDTSVTIPDLSAYGIVLPPAAPYNSLIAGISHASVDALAGAAGLLIGNPHLDLAQAPGPAYTTAP